MLPHPGEAIRHLEADLSCEAEPDQLPRHQPRVDLPGTHLVERPRPGTARLVRSPTTTDVDTQDASQQVLLDVLPVAPSVVRVPVLDVAEADIVRTAAVSERDV
jgi:hypothetical protein